MKTVGWFTLMQLFVIGMHLYMVFDKSEEDYVCR